MVFVETGMGISIPIDKFFPSHNAVKRVPFSQVDFLSIHDEMFGIGRKKRNEPVSKGVNFYSLSEKFSRHVCGKHNKNVIFILFGELGSGKSMALLSLALSCSKWIAKIKGGVPTDYFSMDNVAVIDPEVLGQRLENMKQFGVYLLDDFGSAFDARSFMSTENKSLSHILQTCRTSQNIILVSAPHGAMLDVNLHRLAQYYAEVSESHHAAGITIIKVLKTKSDFRQGKIKRIYTTKKGVSAMRYFSTLPPENIKIEYDKIREENAKILAQKRGEKRDADAAKKADGPQKPGPKDRFSVEEITTVLEGFGNCPTTLNELADRLQTDVNTTKKYMQRAGFEISRTSKKTKGTLMKVQK